MRIAAYCVLGVLIAIIIAELVFNIYFISIYVEGESMYPTLTGAPAPDEEGGDFIFVDVTKKPDYGDIVVLKKTEGGRSYNIIKRAIAFEGDSLFMDGGKLYLKRSGESGYTLIDEPYVDSANNSPLLNINSFSAHVVGEGGIFLLGDNRNASHDSRMDGDYPIKNLVGVTTEWSLAYKDKITSLYTFFKFTIPKSLNII